jgi:hypothetical protein
MINYILLAIGIITVLSAIIMIFLDKLKGDDMYFNIDVKEQELRKVIDDAEEVLSELNFASDIIVKDIEDKINSFNQLYKSASNNLNYQSAIQSAPAPPPAQPVLPIQQTMQQAQVERTVVPVKFKPVTAVITNKSQIKEEHLKSKQQMVHELAEQGVSVIDIAKKMNMGQGEVALILSLKNEESQYD